MWGEIDGAVIAELQAIVGEAHVLVAGDELLNAYGDDWRGLVSCAPCLVIRPADTPQVAAVVRTLSAARLPMVAQGGNTGLCGGAVPTQAGAQAVVSLSRMRRVLEVDPVANSILVEAGCVLEDVQQAALAAGRIFPLALAAQGSCQIGGNIATNAGGVAVLRYGTMRALVQGLEVVLANGTTLDLLAGLKKDNTGLDLKQLFIGSEGTLGIVTRARLSLHPKPQQSVTLMCALSSVENALRVYECFACDFGGRLSAFELIDRQSMQAVSTHIPGARSPFDGDHPYLALVELDDPIATTDLAGLVEALLMRLMEKGAVDDAALAQNLAQAKAFWGLRENISESIRQIGSAAKFDVSLPLRQIPAFLMNFGADVMARHGAAKAFVFGHVGDGNLHLNVIDEGCTENAGQLGDQVYGLVARHGGSFSAEHGVGQFKLDLMQRYKNPAEIELMQRIKAVMDPLGMLNPGKVLPAGPLQ